MSEKSLIITNVFSKYGYKTYTYRWFNSDEITWKDIFEFIYKKTSFTPNYYTVSIAGKIYKYDNLLRDYGEFNINDFIYYNQDGSKTSTGTITLGTDMNTFVHNNVILQW